MYGERKKVIIQTLVIFDGYNSKKKKAIVYRNISSADWWIKLPFLLLCESFDDVSQSSSEFNKNYPRDDKFQCYPEHLKPHLLTEAELNDSVRDLGLIKENAE